MSIALKGKNICPSKAQYGAIYSGSLMISKLTAMSKMTDCEESISVKR
jgi:hypothetical protein